MTTTPAIGWTARLKTALLMVGLFLAGPSLAHATMLQGNHVVLTFGTDDKPHAQITFPKDRAAREGVTIETFRAGGAGSKVAILVDTDNKPVFERSFSAEECTQDKGISHCAISIGALASPAAVLRDRFRRGLVCHLKIETGGSMSMSVDAPLNGFTKAMQ